MIADIPRCKNEHIKNHNDALICIGIDLYFSIDCIYSSEKVKEINAIRASMTLDYFSSSLNKVPKLGTDQTITIKEDSPDYAEYEKFLQRYFIKYTKLLGQPQKKDRLVWAVDNYNYYFGRRLRVIDCDLIFPLKRIAFGAGFYLSPNKPIEFLNMYYGDIFDIPNDMLGHKHFNLSDSNLASIKEILDHYS